MYTLTFITSNPGKVNLLKQHLDFPVIHKPLISSKSSHST